MQNDLVPDIRIGSGVQWRDLATSCEICVLDCMRVRLEPANADQVHYVAGPIDAHAVLDWLLGLL